MIIKSTISLYFATKFHFLNSKEIIHKILALTLLLVFTLSSMPKLFLHEAIADHKDVTTCTHTEKGPCLHQQSFNCHAHDLVVRSPYLNLEVPFYFESFVGYKEVSPILLSPTFYTAVSEKESRGPPDNL